MSIRGGCPLPISRASDDKTPPLVDEVRNASARGHALRIVGGNTRSFYGRPVTGYRLEVSSHSGVIAYDPSELVITARSGPPLTEIEALLAEHDQMLAFEPPRFGAQSTLGGVVASGLSGPRRPFTGSVRDFVLGVRVLDSRGEVLRFGGTVFKNVAGFDAFRLMSGALGCLGVILDVSLRVVPRPRAEVALVREMDSDEARQMLIGRMRRQSALSGAFHDGRRLHLRLSGAHSLVKDAVTEFGGAPEDLRVWDEIRDKTRIEFAGTGPVWRLSLPQTAELPGLPGRLLWDWAGSERWLISDSEDATFWNLAAKLGGHATLFRNAPLGSEVFQPLPRPILDLHRRIKAALDPAGIFNPGRLYEGL